MDDRAEAGPRRLVLVSGHTFGARAFEGVFSSWTFLGGQIEVPLVIGLAGTHASGTVGYQSLGRLAAEHGAPYVSTSDGRLSSLAGKIRDTHPAYILVIGWSHLIGADVLSIPAVTTAAGSAGTGAGQFGCIGMHPTKLPDGRGQAPIPWTIIKGYRKTALTVFFLEPAADTGPIIAQYELDVYERETAASLFYRIAHVHFTAGLDLAEALGTGQVRSRAQDPAIATRWPKRRPRDGEISNAMRRSEIDSLVRALLGPYPRAFIMAEGRKLNIRAVERAYSPGDDSGDGPAVSDSHRIRFPCRDGVIYLLAEDDHAPQEDAFDGECGG